MRSCMAMALVDDRESVKAAFTGLQRQVEDFIAADLEQHQGRVLAEALVSKPPIVPEPSWSVESSRADWTLCESKKLLPTFSKGVARWSYEQRREVYKSVKVEPGDVCIAVFKSVEIKPLAVKRIEHYAFLCREEAAKHWSIIAIQRRIYADPFEDMRADMPDLPPYEPEGEDWSFVDLPYWSLRRLEVEERPSAAAPGLDTKEAAIAALFEDVYRRRQDLTYKLQHLALAAWLETVSTLFLPGTIKEMRQAAEGFDRAARPKIGYEIVEERTNPTALLVRKDDFFKTQWLFELTEENGSWRIVGAKRRFTATRVRDGAEVETLRDAKSIWEATDAWMPDAYSLNIYLR